MFRSVDRSPSRRYRAVTLIEAVLYISIALALIVGGLVFFQQASTAAKTSRMVRELSATIAEARVLVKGIPLTSAPTDIGSYLISAGAVPPSMVQSGELYNPFGGRTTIRLGSFGTGYPVLVIETDNVPQEVCARLLTATSGSASGGDGTSAGATTLVSSGFRSSSVDPSDAEPSFYDGLFRPWIMNPTQAGWMCKYGSLNYTDKTIQPTSQPYSGTVNVGMHFMVEA
jgi:hypothetical protein